ncbi:MAG TPA: hypothetical protein ENN87_00790 [Phycisphaerales bacterium]|nr:hypothetical protein [Phycisphaerales bacterium]
MNHTLIRWIAVLAVAVILVAGCSDKTSDAPEAGNDTTSVKTMDEYRAEAEEEIAEEDAEAQLDELEKEIDADQ